MKKRTNVGKRKPFHAATFLPSLPVRSKLTFYRFLLIDFQAIMFKKGLSLTLRLVQNCCGSVSIERFRVNKELAIKNSESEDSSLGLLHMSDECNHPPVVIPSKKFKVNSKDSRESKS